MPPVPVRPLAIGAAASVIGALLLVLSVTLSWPVVVAVLAGLVLVFGLALGVAAFVMPRRLAVRVLTTPAGYRISSGTVVREGRWVEVVRATQSGSGLRITLNRRDGGEHHIFSPAGRPTAEMNHMAKDVAARLRDRFNAGIDS